MVNSYWSMPPFFFLSSCLPHLTHRSLRKTQVIIYFWSLPQSCKLWALFQQFSQGLGKANTSRGEKHADRVCQFLIPSNWKSTFECHLPSEIITRMNSTNAAILGTFTIPALPFWGKKRHTSQRFLHLGSSQSKCNVMLRLSGEPDLWNGEGYFPYSH